jgi:hypothetical protein
MGYFGRRESVIGEVTAWSVENILTANPNDLDTNDLATGVDASGREVRW